jgi:hypothetical protein
LARAAAAAIAGDGNLAGALRQLGHDIGGVLDVPGTGVVVIGLIKAKAVLPVRLGGDAELEDIGLGELLLLALRVSVSSGPRLRCRREQQPGDPCRRA